MSDQPERNSSSEDELEEILRQYRKRTQQNNRQAPDVPGDEDVRIADYPSSKPEESAEQPEEIRTYDSSAHFGSDEPEETFDSVEPEPGGASEDGQLSSSHFSDDPLGDQPRETEPDEHEQEEEDDPTDLYAGLSKPTRVFLKIGKAFLSMSFLAKALIYIAVVLLISAYLSYYVILLGNDMFALVTENREVMIDVPEDATPEQVTDILMDAGLIESEWFFNMYLDRYASKSNDDIHFISGPHTMNLNMNYSQIMSALTVVVRERQTITLTFPEGYTVDQIIDLFVTNGIGSKEGFVEAINRYPYKHEFVRMLDENGWPKDRAYRLEGYLYPDTYEFYTDTKEYLAINKLLNAFNDKIWVDWKSTYEEEMAKEGYTLDSMIALASIIEAEGKTPEDFEYISYVFHNRLTHASQFPYLESDATIQYARTLAGMERISDPSQLNISYESPYNTYLHDGLPPGAICNPGLDAILAAVYPSPPLDENEAEIDALYFVSNNAGKTYYAHTLSQHEKNKARVKQENEAAAAANAGDET